MEERDEWCFEFGITAVRLILRAVADTLLDKAVEWAEAHRLGIGGGYRPATEEVDKAAFSWAFRFGLCATEDEQLIPHHLATSLWELLSTECHRQGFTCTGGFRAFTAEELGQRL